MKLGKAQTELKIAQAKLAEAAYSLNTATANHDRDASLENARALRKTSDLKELAERKVKSKQKRVSWLSNEIITLEANSIKSENEISQANKKISSLKNHWNKKIQKKNTAQKPVVIQKVAMVTEPKIVKPKVSPVAAAPVVAEKKLIGGLGVGGNPDQGADYSKRKVAEFKTYLSTGVSLDPEIELKVGFSDKSGRIEFDHLGGEVYLGEIKLRKGKQFINYDGSSFRIHVEKENNKKTHLIYFDNRDKNNRDLVVVDKSLLQ
ncbi:MAG: hypothetical protein KTR16_03090 [Acidiferrobacterales bacterium]|nr:hypothetical protein [Acidiferrobacterales bacterium]